MFPIQDSVPSRSVPVITRALILINVLVFFFELMLPRQGLEQVHSGNIQREILDPLSIDILEGKVREGRTVHVNAKDGAMSFRA